MAKTPKAETKKTAVSTKTKSSVKSKTTRARKKKVAEPITFISDQNRPHDRAATFGNPAIVDGIEGYIVTAVSYDGKTGMPDDVLFRPRDNGNTMKTVKYNDVEGLRDGYR